MEAKLLVLKPAKIFGDPDELANFRFANGRGFPSALRRNTAGAARWATTSFTSPPVRTIAIPGSRPGQR